MTNHPNIRYELVETTAYVEDSGIVATYGIRCSRDRPDTQEVHEQIQLVANISNQASFVNTLIDQLNTHHADPAHLYDLIEDYLSS